MRFTECDQSDYFGYKPMNNRSMCGQKREKKKRKERNGKEKRNILKYSFHNAISPH